MIIIDEFLKIKDTLLTQLKTEKIDNYESLNKFIEALLDNFSKSSSNVMMELTKSEGIVFKELITFIKMIGPCDKFSKYFQHQTNVQKPLWITYVFGTLLGLSLTMLFINWIVAVILILISISLYILYLVKTKNKKTSKVPVNYDGIINDIENMIRSIDELMDVYSIQIDNIKRTYER